MALTSLDIRDKAFSTKFRGYDIDEVEEFLDIIVNDYEELIRENHEKEAKIRNLEERLIYFDEMKDSLSQSVLIAQDTAERVKQAAQERSGNIVQQAEQDAQRLLDRAKYKANDILRQATDNAKRVAVETEELKNKTRVFHQRLKSTIESQLSIVDSQDWEDILRPTATYLQTSDEAFKVVVEEALGEKIELEEEVDVTRQFSPEEIAELQERIEQANRELSETQTLQTIDEELIQAQQKEILESVKRSESDEDSKVPVDLL